MLRFQKPVSLNDANPIRNQSSIHENGVEFHKMVEHDVSVNGRKEEEEDEYVTVTAPTNLPAGYEYIVESMDGTFWTVQVVRQFQH